MIPSNACEDMRLRAEIAKKMKQYTETQDADSVQSLAVLYMTGLKDKFQQ